MAAFAFNIRVDELGNLKTLLVAHRRSNDLDGCGGSLQICRIVWWIVNQGSILFQKEATEGNRDPGRRELGKVEARGHAGVTHMVALSDLVALRGFPLDLDSRLGRQESHMQGTV